MIVGRCNIKNLRYVDDTVLIVGTNEKLQVIYNKVKGKLK